MKSFTFIFISVFSGAIAGTFLGVINLGIVEPFLDNAIGIEVQNAIKDGEAIDQNELQSYRIWQKVGQIAGGTILGLSFGALFGITFLFGRNMLPGSNNQRKAVILAGIIWLVIFVVPALKYPPNPPIVGDPETIYERQNMYIIFTAISGITALSLAVTYKKMGRNQVKKFGVVSFAYGIVMIGAFIIVPQNPLEITAPIDLVQGFRIASAFSMSVFWLLLGIIFGSLWEKFKPIQNQKITTF